MFELSTLTGRERDVLARIGEGESTKQIARALAISPATVRSHVRSIYIKLGVRTRAQAAAVIQPRLADATRPRLADFVGMRAAAAGLVQRPADVVGVGMASDSSVAHSVDDCLAPPPAPFDALTRREAEVLRCIVAGISRRAIAERLVLSPHTVRTHARNVLAKLGVHSSLAAAVLLRRAMCAPAG